MKKPNLLLLFISVFCISILVTSCGKDKDPVIDEEQKDEDEEDETLSDYLQGTDYYLITLDETSAMKIAPKVKKDYRTDDVNMFLYVWDGTYEAGVSNGPNAFGEVEGWTSLVVGGGGWSGCGFNTGGEGFFADLSGVTDQHVLHFAMKSRDNATHQIILNGNDDSVVKLTIGTSDFDGVAPYKNFTRDGEWHHIEVPVSYLKDQGLKYTGNMDTNVLVILSGGVQGTGMDIDGIFFYKPK